MSESPKEITLSPDQVAGIYVDGCPLIDAAALRPITECFQCEFFAGIADRMPNDENGKNRSFERRHIVTCKYPRARVLRKVMNHG